MWKRGLGCTKEWIAQIEFQGKRHFLGSYYSKQDAIAARKAAEEKFFKPVLDKYKKIYPTFLKDKIKNMPDNLEYIVTKE